MGRWGEGGVTVATPVRCQADSKPQVRIVNVNISLPVSKLDCDSAGEPGPQAQGLNHLETPQTTARNSTRLLLC